MLCKCVHKLESICPHQTFRIYVLKIGIICFYLKLTVEKYSAVSPVLIYHSEGGTP